jgi:hypothetical protein
MGSCRYPVIGCQDWNRLSVVADDVAKRVLGHAIAGVQGVYDRYDYAKEKADALRGLAAQIDSIIHSVPAATAFGGSAA